MKKAFLFLVPIAVIFFSCDKKEIMERNFKEQEVKLSTHSLMTYKAMTDKSTVVVFETGLGDEASVWVENKVIPEVSKFADIVVYDRAGYGKSSKGPAPRDINKLSSDLEAVIKEIPADKKIILVGHSLGGMIIRDYAIKNPQRVKSLLFIDPAHEDYNNPSQSEEDMIYNLMKSLKSQSPGAAMEARELIEDAAYLRTLPSLPNIPVIVLTSMKTTAQSDAADRQKAYNAHETLKAGVSDFTHKQTAEAGHYIQREDPSLVIESIRTLSNK